MSQSQFKFRLAHFGLAMAAIGFTAGAPLVGLVSSAHAQALRPEIGKPLQAAADMMKQKNARGALAKVREAQAVSGKSAQESFTIDRMMASVAMAAGDNETTIKALENMIESGKLPAGERLKYIQSIGSMYYSAKNYPKAIAALQRAQKEGDNSAQTRALITSARFASGDTAAAARETQAEVTAAEKAGRPAPEEAYQLLANVASKNPDKTQYVAALEKLVTHYPKRDYWADLLNRITGKKGFSDRLSLDVYRLRLSLGLLKTKADFMEMTQLALQAGQGAEAKKIIEAGYSANIMGTGSDVERQNRLRAMTIKTATDNLAGAAAAEAEAIKNKDGYALSNIGYAYVQAGQADKGIKLMEDGIKLGMSKYADHAKLHLGLAYAQAGKKSQAISTWKTVKEADGSADLARYWIIQTNRPLTGN